MLYSESLNSLFPYLTFISDETSPDLFDTNKVEAVFVEGAIDSEKVDDINDMFHLNPIIKKEYVNNYLIVFITALHHASQYGKLKIVKLISESLLDILPQESNIVGTPLHLAARDGEIEVVQYFVGCLIEKNPTNQNGETVMHLAAIGGQLDIINYYLDILPEGQKNPPKYDDHLFVENKHSSNFLLNLTPLHYAARRGFLDIVQAIAKHLNNINPGNSYNYTPLHEAAAEGNLDIVQFYEENLENINLGDYANRTPFHHAALQGRLNVVRYFVERIEAVNPINRDQLINPGDDNNHTPLHNAALSGHLNVVEYLSKKVNDPMVEDDDGLSPYLLAATVGHLNLIEYYVDQTFPLNYNK